MSDDEATIVVTPQKVPAVLPGSAPLRVPVQSEIDPLASYEPFPSDILTKEAKPSSQALVRDGNSD